MSLIPGRRKSPLRLVGRPQNKALNYMFYLCGYAQGCGGAGAGGGGVVVVVVRGITVTGIAVRGLSRRKPFSHFSLLSLEHSFSTAALLTFVTGSFFVGSADLCIA